MNDIRPTVQLSEPVDIPDQYVETCTQFLRQYWQGRRWEMQESFGFHQLPLLSDEDLLSTMLAETLAIIGRAADGQYDRENEAVAGEVYEHIQGLMEHLFCPPGISNAYTIPESFWDSPLGLMVGRAWIWLQQRDELITLKDAAELRGVTIQAISQAIDAGRLRAYIDPDARQRQGRRLVSRKQVKALS